MIPIKIVRINNKDKYISEDNLFPDIFGIGEKYIFDLSHPSNFGNTLLLSKDYDNLEQSDEIKLEGTPGLKDSKLHFTPSSVGNRYFYDKEYGVIMANMLNPLILLKDVEMYNCENDDYLNNHLKPQLYEFGITASLEKMNFFIHSLKELFKSLNLEDIPCSPCEQPVYDNNTNKNNLSTARVLMNDIRYNKGNLNFIKPKINVFGQRSGAPNGSGMPPKNNFV